MSQICPHCGKELRQYPRYIDGTWTSIKNCRKGALTCVQNEQVIKRIQRDEKHSDIARDFGVTHTAIYRIAQRLKP